MQKLIKLLGVMAWQRRWRWLALAAAVLGVGAWLWSGGAKTGAKTPMFAARRGPLEITVLEGGNLQALESQELKCEVRVGYQGTKILRIVDEGYFVTEDDIRTNKVLVELDSSDIQKQIIQQEIQYQSALATLIDSQQAYEIQLSQNETDIHDAQQKARFARLDFDRFLGDTVTAQIINQVGLDRLLEAANTNNVEQTLRASEVAVTEPSAGPAGKAPTVGSGTNLMGMVSCPTNNPTGGTIVSGNSTPPETAEPNEGRPPKALVMDFSKYAHIDALGDGEAKQKLRKFEDDLQVAQKEIEQAKAKLEGTRRLFDKGFVTKTEWQQDDIAYENSRLKVVTAETARDLFLKYEFLKSAEEALTKYADAVHEFDKARRVAVSKLAQAKARLKSAQGQYEVQTRQLKDLNDQLGKCTLRAQKSGLVVYGGSRDDMVFYGGEERIREGATVRERQAIITIPDMSRMSVNVRIHESYIKKIRKGLKARITVDAFPDTVLTGEVTKVGVLPDSMNRWMNPDMKVYLTTITIDGTYDWVKPGMTAKAEILVNKLDDCVYVPVQAVSPDNGKQVCYVGSGLKPERREIQIGEFNDEFIEIKNGLKEGERVLLRARSTPESGEPTKAAKDQKQPENNHKPPPVPVSGPATASKV